VSSGVAQKICEAAKISTRANPRKFGRQEADSLYKAIQETKISAPATDCISPIGESLILKGLHHQLPGEFFCAATRPPAVSIPRTAQWVTTAAPCRRAASAIAGAALCGSALPSLAV